MRPNFWEHIWLSQKLHILTTAKDLCYNVVKRGVFGLPTNVSFIESSLRVVLLERYVVLVNQSSAQLLLIRVCNESVQADSPEGEEGRS